MKREVSIFIYRKYFHIDRGINCNIFYQLYNLYRKGSHIKQRWVNPRNVHTCAALCASLRLGVRKVSILGDKILWQSPPHKSHSFIRFHWRIQRFSFLLFPHSSGGVQGAAGISFALIHSWEWLARRGHSFCFCENALERTQEKSLPGVHLTWKCSAPAFDSLSEHSNVGGSTIERVKLTLRLFVALCA